MFYELFIRDWLWKLFSLLLAVAIWFTVHRVLVESAEPVKVGDTNRITYASLPVTLVSDKADVRLYRVVPAQVQVVVAGSPEAMSVLNASQIRVTADLSGFDFQRDLKTDVEVSVPPGITLVSVDPPRVGVIAPPAASTNFQ